MIDDVIKMWELQTPPNNCSDRAGTRTANALWIRAVPPDGLTRHLDEPFFDPPGRKVACKFVAHQSGSLEWSTPFALLRCNLACNLSSA
jgi:hypothetical protein